MCSSGCSIGSSIKQWLYSNGDIIGSSMEQRICSSGSSMER